MSIHFQTVYTTVIHAPIEKVWDALTNPDLVKQYFFGTQLICDWRVGEPIYFQGEWEGKPYQDKGIVQSYTHNESLSYTYLSNWSGLPDLLENYLLISYAVKLVDNGTELTISQTNYDEEKAKHSEANWSALIDGLKKIIE